jgi:3-oxoacyl-[acyl-carrier-protein] synthase II
MRRVVVTGMGMVTAVGNDLETSWRNTLDGNSGIDRISSFDPAALSVQIAGEAKNFEIGDSLDAKESSRASRFIAMAAKAGQEAMLHSQLAYSTAATERWGCSIGVGLGSLADIEKNTMVMHNKGPRRVTPFFIPYTIPNLASGVVSKYYNLKGPNICTTTACASGTHAVGEGLFYIQRGIADVMLCGGAESAISPLGIAGFAVMKALSTDNDNPKTASKPFDKNRDGFVMGEGAGVMVVEELEHAKARGATIYAELVGYGMSGDAHHITAPSPEGMGAERCMRMALETGDVPVDQVDYINAHGTSTKLNDWYESLAIGRLFGEQAKKLAVSSTKGVTGHCLGAAGGIEAVFSAMAIHHGMIPPTANYTTKDVDCPLDYVVEGARRADIRYALSNSFGFGGTNATIAFKKFSQ